MILAIASDHSGHELKKHIINYLTEKGYKILDLGTNNTEKVDYPDFARLLCENILDQNVSSGILICGTGIGMSICANRFSGIRAAICTSPYMAKKSRSHNDSNVLVLGAKIISQKESEEILEEFLNTKFEGGRHIARLQKID